MTNTLKKNAVMILAAALAVIMIFAVAFAPVSLADNDNGVAAAVEKTQANLEIIKGMTATTFAPNDTATRAQAAVIMMRTLAALLT